MKKVKSETSYYTDVKVIQTRGQSSLVEWVDENGAIQRVYVSSADVEDKSRVPAESLEMGIPYGLPFTALVKLEATPEKVERELHRRGIWTVDDLITRGQEVISALQAVYGMDFAALKNAAQEYKRSIE